MIYRKKLDEETEKLLKRNLQPMVNQNHNLTETEENRLKSLFWGTNFTIDDILKGIKDKKNKTPKNEIDVLNKSQILFNFDIYEKISNFKKLAFEIKSSKYKIGNTLTAQAKIQIENLFLFKIESSK